MRASLQRYYELHPSRGLMWLLSASCLPLLFVLYSLPYAIGLRVAGCIFVIAVMVFVGLRDAGLRLAQSCVAFRLESEMQITLIQRNGREVAGEILADSLVTPFLVLMNIQISGQMARSIVLMPDSMGRDDLRRLRVMLRWNG